jgi:transposase InsO family protein
MMPPGGHLSAAEIAALQLPGLPGSKKGVLNRAEAERWSWIERKGRGGGRLYAIADLPEQARAVLEQRTAKLIPANLRPVGRPQGSDFFTRNPEIADAVEALIAEQSRSAMRVLELLSRRFHVLPSRRSLSRFIAKLETEKAALLASTRNPDLFNSRYRISLGRADGSVTHANQVWELDTTPVDVQLKGGRKAILGVIDRYSRRARFLVADSESGQSVRRLLIDTIRAWGVMPETVMTDNGSGYINGSIISALETLGIEHFRCPPGSPWKKPFIERLFGTFTRERAELLDGYSGHNVAEAQALRSREKKRTGKAVILPSMEADELQAVLDAWLDGVYHRREHSGIRAAPLDRWRQSCGLSTKAPSEDVLRIALSKLIGSAKVGKRGVQWKHGRYWSPPLAPWIGRMVTIRRDEDELGAIFVFDENGSFIDTAINHERAGISEEQFARAARRHQDEHMNQARAELRQKQRAFRFEDARDQLLRDDALAAGKLAILPGRTEARSTPQLDSIATAPAPAVPDQARLDDAMRRTAPRRAAEPSTAEKVAWADRILRAELAGEDVDPAELARARLFASTTAYRAQKALMAPFQPSTPTHAARRHSA